MCGSAREDPRGRQGSHGSRAGRRNRERREAAAGATKPAARTFPTQAFSVRIFLVQISLPPTSPAASPAPSPRAPGPARPLRAVVAARGGSAARFPVLRLIAGARSARLEARMDYNKSSQRERWIFTPERLVRAGRETNGAGEEGAKQRGSGGEREGEGEGVDGAARASSRICSLAATGVVRAAGREFCARVRSARRVDCDDRVLAPPPQHEIRAQRHREAEEKYIKVRGWKGQGSGEGGKAGDAEGVGSRPDAVYVCPRARAAVLA